MLGTSKPDMLLDDIYRNQPISESINFSYPIISSLKYKILLYHSYIPVKNMQERYTKVVFGKKSLLMLNLLTYLNLRAIYISIFKHIYCLSS